jgi:hypothetical protein
MTYVAPSTVTTLQTYTSAAHNVIVNDIIDHETRINDSGLVIITPTSVSGTGVTSSGGLISVSAATTITVNGVFSAAYDNYRIVITLVSSAAAAISSNFRLTASGTPDSTAGNYYYASTGRVSDGSATSDSSGTTATRFVIGSSGTGLGQLGTSIDLFNPFAAQRASLSTQYSYFNTPTLFYSFNLMGAMTVTTSYDGFEISTGTATTQTGSIRVYGYQNS